MHTLARLTSVRIMLVMPEGVCIQCLTHVPATTLSHWVPANPHFSPGGVNHWQGIGPLGCSEDDQKYSVLFKHAYHGSGWSSCP